jgi:hypothetical protein
MDGFLVDLSRQQLLKEEPVFVALVFVSPSNFVAAN